MINTEELAKKLIRYVPELKDAYKLELKQWGSEKPGPYNLFWDVLSPFLLDLIDKDKNEPVTQRTFDFLESLAESSDPEVEDLVVIAILEDLVFSPDRFKASSRWMGPRTRAICEKITSEMNKEEAEISARRQKWLRFRRRK